MSLVVLRRSGSCTSLAEEGKIVGALKDPVNNSGWFTAKTRYEDYDNYQPPSVVNTKDLEDTLSKCELSDGSMKSETGSMYYRLGKVVASATKAYEAYRGRTG